MKRILNDGAWWHSRNEGCATDISSFGYHQVACYDSITSEVGLGGIHDRQIFKFIEREQSCL